MIENAGPAIWYVVFMLGAAAATAVLQDALVRILPRVWPLNQTKAEKLRGLWFERAYSDELGQLAIVEFLVSVAAMFLLPFVSYQLLRASIGPARGDLVIFWGAPGMIFAHLIAGAFAGPFLTRWYVRARFGGDAPEVLEAYERSEDRHGSIGRLALRYAGLIALLLVVLSAFFSANRYTVLRAHGVDIARRGTLGGRMVLPYASVVSIAKSGKDHVVRFAGGRTMTTKESLLKTGDLAGSGKTPRRAVELISARSGRPIVEEAR